MDRLGEILRAYGQEHLLKFYQELSETQKNKLLVEIEKVDWKRFSETIVHQLSTLVGQKGNIKPGIEIDENLLEPLPSECIEGTLRCGQDQLEEYRKLGLVNVADNKVAAILLAGGQGTRLGVDYPKGMFDVGLRSHKSLFELQADRIKKLMTDCQSHKREGAHPPVVTWYIMTSGPTMKATRDFFESHSHFGLDRNNVVLFKQDTVPCFDFNGRVLLDEKHKISRSPDGNGGLFKALHRKGIINDMLNRGIEYVHAYAVDNVLVRVCDPVFLGYCISKHADAGTKVIEKLRPDESVGTICKVGDHFKVIEYSEIPANLAERRDVSTGKLVFNAANICEQFFAVKFLKSLTDNQSLPYHIAIKKIPHVNLDTGVRIIPSDPNGIKLEKFIFDVFRFTSKFVAWEVERLNEFSPLKNAPGSEKDNPATALEALERAYKLGMFDS